MGTGGTYNRSTCRIQNDIEASNYLELAQQAEKNAVYVPQKDDGILTWCGTIGAKEWNPVSPIADEDCGFEMSGVGGCYAVSGVDWDSLKNPVLTLHTDSEKGSVGYALATSVNADNPYYMYIEEGKEKIKGTWNFSKDEQIDLSAMNLSGGKTFYIRFNKDNFNEKVTLSISEKN